MAEKDTASRKWQLTFNNPQEHGWTHDKIREVLRTFKTLCYGCMADETGAGEHTPHTHLFINLAPSNCRFSTLKSKFPGAHIEKALGTSRENRDYILKDGKWKESEKGTTSIEGTFEEFGECPEEQQGKSREADRILELLKDGANNLEVIEAVPSAMKIIDKVERTRSLLRDVQFASSWRDLTVTYLFGKTGSGKTCSVMDTYASSYFHEGNVGGEVRYRCICDYCGDSFTAYASDLQQSYNSQVSELPSPSLDSEGYLLWYPKLVEALIFFDTYSLSFKESVTGEIRDDRFFYDFELFAHSFAVRGTYSRSGSIARQHGSRTSWDDLAPIAGYYALSSGFDVTGYYLDAIGNRVDMSQSASVPIDDPTFYGLGYRIHDCGLFRR